jgi:N6-L-threonylcarbamoyladenine synthase
MKILGIESSADDTGAAVIEDGRRMLSNVKASSLDLHAFYGGIVPEIAARSHIEVIIPVIRQALDDAGCDWGDIDAIAVTQGPGLIGSLLVGVLTARTLAIIKKKPLIPINHVLAHTAANYITEANPELSADYQLPTTAPEFPFISLTVSGGHSQVVLYSGYKEYNILGQTLDDAVGEAYDKVAKILGLPYPGGPSIDQASKAGDPDAIKLPIAKLDNPYDFSFSGLKTAVLRAAQELSGHDYTFPSYRLVDALTDKQKADLAASFQKTAVETLVRAVEAAVRQYQPKNVVLAGGVAANQALRRTLKDRLGTPLLCPDIKLCTDNAAMVAAAAFYQHDEPTDPYKLTVIPSF